MTSDEFVACFALIAAAFPNATMPAETVVTYRRALGDFDARELADAIGEFIDTDTSGFPPTIGQICAITKRRHEESTARARAGRHALPPPRGEAMPWYVRLQRERMRTGEEAGLPLEEFVADGEAIRAECARRGVEMYPERVSA